MIYVMIRWYREQNCILENNIQSKVDEAGDWQESIIKKEKQENEERKQTKLSTFES